ncbi:GmrSD restriction endonuclease domain-containing protein [Kocuria arenosa]|uniref:GmrSD restriction endonuclease domain-containing protein n=1 Tax=Kocuria arenosa TaxID=3071446 RepID=UPI0034D6FE53
MSNSHDHFFFPSLKPRTRNAKRYGLLGCGGCLGLAVLVFALIGVLTTLGLGGGSSASTTASSDPSNSTTPMVSPTATPEPVEPTAIDGEVLLGHAEGGEVEAADGEAPREALDSDVEAIAALGALEVKGRAPKTGYDREKFGEAWADVDGNGCDTRNDILYRDLTGPVTSDGCTVTRGTLNPDPYTDTTIDFVRGPATSADVQIDHVVALSDAWQKGAQQLDADTRVLFANDPLNLLAVDGPTNQEKGDKDAASWLPPNKDFRCEYVAIQIAVKAKYDLWITQAEKDAMKRVLDTCQGQALPEDDGTVAGADDALDVATEPDPAPARKTREAAESASAPIDEAPAGGGSDSGAAPEAPAAPVAPAVPAAPAAPAPAAPATAYANCSAARAAGGAPVYAGGPGYGPHLDRDGDGVGCE